MVSIVVLAFGVIGAAGMQLTALRSNKQSALQTHAVQLATDIADRMRANDAQMKAAGGNVYLALDYKAADGAPSAPSKSCFANACDPAELASFEVYEWQRRVRALFPGGRARICRDATPWDDAARSLQWECDEGAGTTASLVVKIGWPSSGPDGNTAAPAGASFPPKLVLTVEPYVQ